MSSSPPVGARNREQSNVSYLHSSNVAAVLNDMVTFLLCNKPEDELDSLVSFLERRQQQITNVEGNNGGSSSSSSPAAPAAPAAAVPRPPSAPREQMEVAPRRAASPPSNDVPAATEHKAATAQKVALPDNATLIQHAAPTGPIAEGEEDVAAVADQMLQADDELMHSLLSGGSFGPSAAASRLQEAFTTVEGGEAEAVLKRRELAVAGLKNNEEMLAKLLSLCINERSSTGCFDATRAALHNPSSSSSSSVDAKKPGSQKKGHDDGDGEDAPGSYYFSMDRERRAEKLRERLEQEAHGGGARTDAEMEDMFRSSEMGLLCANVEKRIARSAALRRCIMTAGTRIDDPAVRDVIFFVSCSSTKYSQAAASTSSEIDALLSEILYNAQSAIAALEQQIEVGAHGSSGGSEAEAEAEQLRQWVLRCNETALVAQRLREQARAVMRTPVVADGSAGQEEKEEGNENDDDGDDDIDARQLTKLLITVSPHAAELGVAGDDVMSFIRSCRTVFKNYNTQSENLAQLLRCK